MKNKKKMCFGVIIGTRAYFNSELAKDVRKQLLETLTKEGYDYVILPEDATPTGSSSIETREDGLKCAKLFRENRDRIDGIIVSLPNFGFEIGIINAISVDDLNVPVLVQACDDENDKVDLDSRRDAFCGKISVCNNLYQYGIPFTDTTLHTYSIYSDLLAADINKFAAICRVVNGLRHARIGAIGTRPAGFQTVRASEKLLQASGITVVPVDLSEILSAARKIEDADETLQAKLKEIRQYAAVPEQYNDKLILQAKFGVAVEQWMEANEIDAVAIQCWDSLEQNYGCAACVTMSMLSEKLIPAAVVDNAGNYRTMLEKEYHRYPALIPESPFMDDKAPGKVKKVKMVWTYEGPVLFWTAPKAKDEMDKAVQYVVYRFDKKEKVNLDDASHIVAITRDHFYPLPYNDGKTKYQYVVTALDRLHNESKGTKKKVKL